MIKWILILLAIAAIASLLGFRGVAGLAGTGAKILIAIVLIPVCAGAARRGCNRLG